MSARHDNWMPLYCEQYRRVTTRLSESLRGMYVDLLLSYWQDGPLPDDDDQLWRIARTTPGAWAKARPALSVLFVVGNGVWRDEWLDGEIATAQAHVAKKSSAGKAGAYSRWNGRRMTDALAKSVRPQCVDDAPSPSPEFIAPAINLVAAAPRPPKGTRLPADWTLPEDWHEWASHNWPHAGMDEIWNQADVFRDYWTAQPGQKGVKTDWPATWRNWIRRAAKGSRNDKLGRPFRDGGKDAALTAIFGMLDRPDGGPVGAGGEHPSAHRGDSANGLARLGKRDGAGDFD